MASNRVHPVRRDQDSRDDHRDRAEQVGQHLEVGPAYVQVLGLVPAQDDQPGGVGQRADDGDGEHQAGLDLARLAQPVDRLDQHPDGHPDQQQGVAQRGQHLGPLHAVRAARAGGPGAQAGPDQGQHQSGGVGQHVAGVGQQGQRAGEQAADDLGHEDDAGDGQHQGQPAPVRRWSRSSEHPGQGLDEPRRRSPGRGRPPGSSPGRGRGRSRPGVRRTPRRGAPAGPSRVGGRAAWPRCRPARTGRAGVPATGSPRAARPSTRTARCSAISSAAAAASSRALSLRQAAMAARAGVDTDQGGCWRGHPADHLRVADRVARAQPGQAPGLGQRPDDHQAGHLGG